MLINQVLKTCTGVFIGNILIIYSFRTVNGITGNNLTVDAGSTMNSATFLVSTGAAGNNYIINGTFKTAVIASKLFKSVELKAELTEKSEP